MVASAYVGRVGGLAVALGIGAAITASAGAAWASPPDSSPSIGDIASRSSTAGVPATASPSRGRAATVRPQRFAAQATISSDSAAAPLKAREASAVRRQSSKKTEASVTARAEQQVAPSIGEIIQDTLFHKSAVVAPRQQPISGGIVTGTLNASTDNGVGIIYTLTQAPTSGGVVIAQDGSFSYTPNAGLVATGGTDTFSVTIDNGNPALRLNGIGGAIQGIIATLAQLVGLRQPDAITVAVPVNVTGLLQRNTVINTIDVPNSYGRPIGIAVSPDGKRVYLANYSINVVPPFFNINGPYVQNYSLAVIDTATNVLSAPIAAGEHPFQVALSPDGNRAYVANSLGGLFVVNTASNAVVGRAASDGSLNGMAIAPDGSSIYLADGAGVAVVDTATNSTSTTIPLGKTASGIAINPAGTHVYVSGGRAGENDTVSVIDTATNAVSATISITGPAEYSAVHVIAVSPDGHRVYVSSPYRVVDDAVAQDSLSVIDTATNTVIGNPIHIGSAPRALVFSADGSRLYVASGSGTVLVIDTATDAVTVTIPVGSYSIAGLALSPDGTRLYATDEFGGKVAVIAI